LGLWVLIGFFVDYKKIAFSGKELVVDGQGRAQRMAQLEAKLPSRQSVLTHAITWISRLFPHGLTLFPSHSFVFTWLGESDAKPSGLVGIFIALRLGQVPTRKAEQEK
jgi:hypothetical protein